MGMRGSTWLGAVVLLSAVVLVSAAPARWVNPADGLVHFYDFVPTGPIEFEDARRRAFQSTHGELRGHLATLTSAAEHTFVKKTFAPLISNTVHDEMGRNAWIGMLRASETALKWVTGEGDMDAQWCDGEPNNGSGDENCVHVFVFGGNDWCWNDIASRNDFVQGYLVEYDDLLDVDYKAKPPAVPWGKAEQKPPAVPWKQGGGAASRGGDDKEKPLITTTIDIEVDGRVLNKQILTYRNDDPYQVARRFADENNLSADHAEQLGTHIKDELESKGLMRNGRAVAPEGAGNARAGSGSGARGEPAPKDDKIYSPNSAKVLKADGSGVDASKLDPPVLFNLTEDQRRTFADCLTECIRAIPDTDAYDVKPIVNCSKVCTSRIQKAQ